MFFLLNSIFHLALVLIYVCACMQTLFSSSVQLPCREQREQQGIESGERREEEEEGEERKVTVHLLRQRKTQFSEVSHSHQMTHNSLEKSKIVY